MSKGGMKFKALVSSLVPFSFLLSRFFLFILPLVRSLGPFLYISLLVVLNTKLLFPDNESGHKYILSHMNTVQNVRDIKSNEVTDGFSRSKFDLRKESEGSPASYHGPR